mgnify:CR=1 FL=1
MKSKNEKTIVRSVKYNYAMNVILRISTLIFPLITLPYITRTIGAIGNGRIAFATSIINYFSMFAQLGIPTYGIRACAKVRDDREKLSKTVQELLIVNFISVSLSYLLLILCLLFVGRFQQDKSLILINSVSLVLNAIGMEWLYQALEQYQYITLRNIGFKVISIILMFLFVRDSADVVIYAALTVASSGGSNILNFLHAKKILCAKFYDHYNLKQHIKPIIAFFALSVAVSVYTNMDTAMLGFISSESEVAYYNLATKIKLIVAMMVSALGPVIMPRITYCLERKDYQRFESLIRNSVELVMILSSPLTVFFLLMAPQVIDVLGGNEYFPAVSCMRIIMFTIIPLGIGNIASMQVLAPMGMETKTLISTICGALINFIVNALLIPHIGADGAAVGTVATELVVTIIQIYYAREYLKGIISYRNILKILFASLLAGILLSLPFFPTISNSFLMICFNAVVYFSAFGLVLLATKEQLTIKLSSMINTAITQGSKN